MNRDNLTDYLRAKLIICTFMLAESEENLFNLYDFYFLGMM